MDFLGWKDTDIFLLCVFLLIESRKKALDFRVNHKSRRFFGMEKYQYFFIIYTDRRSKIGKNYLILELIMNLWIFWDGKIPIFFYYMYRC